VFVTDANGVTITNTFDDLGRVLSRGYPDGGVEHFGYSAAGLIAYTNQIGMSNFFAYDAAGRKTFETNANAELIRYTNNAAGDLLSLTDGKGQTTRWGYDTFGRVTNKVDQAGSVILKYSYDPENRLLSRWSAEKGITYYTNDAIGNLTYIKYPVSPSVSFKYDPLNRRTNMVDAVGTTVFRYTAGNLLQVEDGPFASDNLTNTYVNRLRTGLALQQPSGVWTNAFAYDAAGRLTNVVSSAGSFTNFYLSGVGGASGYCSRLVRRQGLPNGAGITNKFDGVGRMLATHLRTSTAVLTNKHEYLYNLAGQRTNETRMDGSTVAFAYDKIGQLTVADSSVSTEDLGYAYDDAWNLIRRTNWQATTSYDIFNIGLLNELTNAYIFGDFGNHDMIYDANGNMTSLAVDYNTPQTLVYDDENRLVQWFTAGDTNIPNYGDQWTQFYYDGTGRLRERIDLQFTNDYSFGDIWAVRSDSRYIYDGWRVVQERDGNDTPQVAYTRGIDLSGTLEGAGGIGGLLARSDGYSSGNFSSHAFYHADAGGNVTFLLGTNQSMAARYRYDPFGNMIAQSGSLADANVYRFSSKEIHVNSGLYYYGYRWYSPQLQRWITRDPLSEGGSVAFPRKPANHDRDLIDLNCFYSFSNDPINHNDPDGRCAICVIVVVVGLAVIVAGCTKAPPPCKVTGGGCIRTGVITNPLTRRTTCYYRCTFLSDNPVGCSGLKGPGTGLFSFVVPTTGICPAGPVTITDDKKYVNP
jgi:RHS repeat-associated protein